jgi:hypothetical protein
MWRFVNTPDEQIVKLLQEAGMPEPLLKQLLDPRSWRKQGPLTSLLPTPEIILGLPEAARAKIYAELALTQENLFHVEPFPVYGGNVQTWLGGSDLRPEILNAIGRTSYKRFNATLFSDVALLYSMAQSDAERIQITKALSRTPALMVKMRTTTTMDLERVASYWTAGFKRKDVEPFIESLMRNPAAEKLDIIHLLPPTARKLLNTFPHPSQYAFFGQLPDCHWSSLNFFNYDTLPRLANEAMAGAFVAENFELVMPPHQLGDVLFFTDKTGNESYHSCVFIADDIVFTKNGRSVLRPWVLMKLGDVSSLYSKEPEVQIKGYRRKRPMGE